MFAINLDSRCTRWARSHEIHESGHCDHRSRGSQVLITNNRRVEFATFLLCEWNDRIRERKKTKREQPEEKIHDLTNCRRALLSYFHAIMISGLFLILFVVYLLWVHARFRIHGFLFRQYDSGTHWYATRYSLAPSFLFVCTHKVLYVMFLRQSFCFILYFRRLWKLVFGRRGHDNFSLRYLQLILHFPTRATRFPLV